MCQFAGWLFKVIKKGDNALVSKINFGRLYKWKFNLYIPWSQSLLTHRLKTAEVVYPTIDVDYFILCYIRIFILFYIFRLILLLKKMIVSMNLLLVPF